MNITDITIRRTFHDKYLKAIVSIVVDGVLAIHDIKVIEGPERLFIAMPSRKGADGQLHDIVHPINAQYRKIIEKQILDAYKDRLHFLETHNQCADSLDNAAENHE